MVLRWLAESTKVAKLVMSSTSPARSRSNTSTIRAAIARSAARKALTGSASMASQKRRWSNAAAGSLTSRSPAVLCHQPANASLERGATTRFNAARAR